MWHIPQIPGNPFCVNVESLEEASKVLFLLAIYDENSDGNGTPGWIE